MLVNLRHCERSEAIHLCLKVFWIASSLVLLAMTSKAYAQDDDFAQRLVLAEKMLELRPTKDQLHSALDTYINNYLVRYSEQEQLMFRSSVLKAINEKALKKTAVDAYAETFTLPELKAMVEYYSKPEARSASDKLGELSQKISPEIIRMLDQALMKVRAESAQ